MANFIEEIVKSLFQPSQKELQTFRDFVGKQTNKHQQKRLENEVKKVYKDAPRIALIGKTGVGKSSTINALFNPTRPFKVGHVVATTKRIRSKMVSLGRGRGAIVIFDCPGLNESIQADEKIIPIYTKLLGECDVALWILKADDRALAEDQKLILKVLSENLKKRFIVGLNQIDLIQPGKWNMEYNLPSKEQEESIKLKEMDILKKLKSIRVAPQFVISYSALHGYRLTHLFRAMLEACPVERAWLLSSRKNISPYHSPKYSNASV